MRPSAVIKVEISTDRSSSSHVAKCGAAKGRFHIGGRAGEDGGDIPITNRNTVIQFARERHYCVNRRRIHCRGPDRREILIKQEIRERDHASFSWLFVVNRRDRGRDAYVRRHGRAGRCFFRRFQRLPLEIVPSSINLSSSDSGIPSSSFRMSAVCAPRRGGASR